MTQKSLGMTAIIDNDNRLLGIFTDGDLRRTLDAGIDIHKTKIESIMHRDCKVTGPDILAAEAVRIMEKYKITGLLVTDDEDRLIGALNIHDLLRAGVM